MDALNSFSTKDLVYELQKRHEEKTKEQLNLKLSEAKNYLNSIPHMLALVNHNSLGCSDDNIKDTSRCIRCFLLNAQATQIWNMNYEPRFMLQKVCSFGPHY